MAYQALHIQWCGDALLIKPYKHNGLKDHGSSRITYTMVWEHMAHQTLQIQLSLGMIKGHKTNARITEFGEVVLFKIPKTKLNPGKFEDKWDAGVYVGYDMRTMESLVGTPAGVFKVTDIRRRPLQERWSADRAFSIAGSPKAPVPGQAYRRVPAFAKQFSRADEGEYVPQPTPVMPNIRTWKIYKRDVEEH